jgi:hypothetical protein
MEQMLEQDAAVDVPSSLTVRLQPPAAPQAKREAVDSAFSFFEGIPVFAETELERLYANLFSSLALFRAFGMDARAHTYVAWRNGVPAAVILFRREGSKAIVLNEQIWIGEQDLQRFADHLFGHYPQVRSIVFRAVATDLRQLSYPYQRVAFTNDIVLTLPADAQAYLASLGKSTRQNIRHYLNRIRREHPDFAFEVRDREAIAQADLHAVIALNRARMRAKNKTCGVDEEEERRLFTLAQRCGVLGMVRIAGEICAGALCYRVGDNFFLRVIAHDDRFHAYGVGTLCCYLMICECIARGGRQYHFMWGREEYKYRLLGQQRDFDAITLYRSHASYAFNAPRIVRGFARSRIASAKLWLLDPQHRHAPAARVAHALAKTVRAARS